MGTKTVRLDEDLHARIRAYQREEETLSETIDRLLAPPSILELRGLLTDEQAEEFRDTLDEHDEEGMAETDELLAGFERF